MKISPLTIVRDHLGTLRHADSRAPSKGDVILFYAVPLALGIASYWGVAFSTKDFYNVSLTFFGIFVALLLNIQVAVFGIFQRKWDRPADQRGIELQDSKIEERRKLLREVNANISYAIVISCVSLFVYIVFYIFNYTKLLSSMVSVVIYTHFLLTLLMIIKRSHALFRKEYDEDV